MRSHLDRQIFNLLIALTRLPRPIRTTTCNTSPLVSHRQHPLQSTRSARSIMQTSITSFFKVQTPAKKRKREDESDDDQGDDENKCEPADGDSHKSAEIVDLDESNDGQKGTPREETRSKRAALVDSDDDDDDVIRGSGNRKRNVLSSAESTPVKPAPVKSEPAEREADAKPKAETETKPAGGDSAQADPSQVLSPARLGATRQLMMGAGGQSPLFNPETLIRKKIESGAKALHENIGVSWFKALQGEFDKPYFKKLSAFVEEQRKANTVYPPADQVFTWTHYHAIKDTRVVIIGQDPYHGPNQAHGLSFSVQKGVAIPKSLINIYKELTSDIDNFKNPGHGNLTGWSKQGVLMLNACLTVTRGKPNSHQGKGWETFTDATITWISKNASQNCVFLLWGRFAQQKSKLIDKRHKILTSAHPSPLSADQGFFGCKHFSQTNAFLRSQKLPEIDWAAL